MTIDLGRVRLDDVWETLEALLKLLWRRDHFYCPYCRCDREVQHTATCTLKGLWWFDERLANDLEPLG